MKNNYFAFLFTLLMSMVANVASGAYIDGIYYNFNTSNETATVISASITYFQGDVTIPESVTYNGTTYSVTSIDEKAFNGKSDMTSITIGNNITTIGDYTFFNCSGLTSITISKSVTNIGNDVFAGCWRLERMVVEDGNAVYDSRDNCNAIIETAYNYLRFGCNNTTIPNGVKGIGRHAFEHLGGLTSVTIPESVIYIDPDAFVGCWGLESIMVEDGNTVYDSRDNCNAIIATAYNSLMLGCKNTTIPNSVTSIGDIAFYFCRLTSITIPSSVTSISANTFYGCSDLTSVTVAWETPIKLTSPYIFSNANNATLYVPKGTKEAYKAAPYWQDFKEIIEIEMTGIDQLTIDNGQLTMYNEAGAVYDLNGRQQSKMQRGINIVRDGDGTTKRVLVK